MVVTVMGVTKGYRQFTDVNPKLPKNYYEWTEASLEGHTLYRQMGCNSCHRAMGVGEIGIAPSLDGEGTRRTEQWLLTYFRDPSELVEGTAHDGKLGPDFRLLSDDDRTLLSAFLFALKANPGSPSYPRPPQEVLVKN